MKNLTKFLKLFYFLALSFVAHVTLAQTVTVASDDLDTNTVSGGTGWIGNWSTTGTVSFTGGRIFMDGDGNGTASRSVNLTGFTSATLSILGRCEDSSSGFESDDSISVEVSTNGGSTYTTVWSRSGSQICPSDDDEEDQNIFAALPVGNANTIIRLVSGTDSDTEDYFWDDVVVTAFQEGDADGDGVDDSVDDDDDNDGILDDNECGIGVQGLTTASVQAIPDLGATTSVFTSTAGGTANFVSSQLYIDNYLNATAGDNFPDDAIVYPDQDDYADNSANISDADVDWTVTTVSFQFPIPVTDFQITGYDFDDGGENFNSISVQPTSTSSNVVNNSGTYESNADNQVVILNFNLTNPISVISFNLERPSNNFTIAFTVAFDGCLADRDEDGIFDYLDIDSDGDGCFDVVESGGVANGMGELDGTGINPANGRVTGGTGGYDGAGTNFNTANQLAIDTDPTDQVVAEGDANTTFTVGARVDAATSYSSGTPIYGTPGNANGTLQYQWYDGDPDGGGVALSNDATYSGVTTATLTVANPNPLAPKTFYVVVTTSALSTECAREVRSAEMTPAVNPCDAAASGNTDTDGDGVSDVCDVDDDNDGILDVDEDNN